jgi:hypothetical protein
MYFFFDKLLWIGVLAEVYLSAYLTYLKYYLMISFRYVAVNILVTATRTKLSKMIDLVLKHAWLESVLNIATNSCSIVWDLTTFLGGDMCSKFWQEKF